MIVELLKLVWPYLREFFLGKEQGVKEAIKGKQWKKLAMLIAFTISLGFNLYTVPLVYRLTSDVYHQRLQIQSLKRLKNPEYNPQDEHPKNQLASDALAVSTTPAPPPEPAPLPQTNEIHVPASLPPRENYTNRRDAVLEKLRRIN